jgi:small-conductance mechanosensitive channel
VIRNPFINRLVAISTWTIAALALLNLLDPVTGALDATAITIGGLRISPLLVLKATALLVIALWIAAAAGNTIARRMHSVAGLTPSMQTLIGNVVHVTLLAIAVVVVLGSVGIDLTALAWFSGAVGVGLGFGLQKIIANFVSGIILLSDKSIKPGDVITIGDNFGWVASMGARYTSVDLKDGRELLVPNEDLITQRVINWSYTSDLMRLEVKFSTSYASAIDKTRAAAVAAAQSVPQVLSEPKPVCHLVNYGNAIEYLLWFWIKDAATGPTAVRSAVLMALWDTFAREGIEIPKPGATHVVLEQPQPK